MKSVNLLVGMVLVLGLLATPVAAEEVDRVLLASEENYPDALIGSSVSEKLGFPVILTEKEELSEEAEEALEEYAPEKVVVLGGPAVVSEEVIGELEDEYSVDRLWGMTRYRTAQEAIDRFWPEGSEEAVLVEDTIEDRRGEVMAAARGFAGERPVLPVPEGKIPAGVLNQLEEMDVEEVDVIATEISEEMRQDLEELDVETGEEVTAEDREQLRDEARERAKEGVRPGDNLLVVASQGHRDVISGNSLPDHVPFLVSDEEEIDEVVELVNEEEIEEVKIVGNPELASSIGEALEEETDAEVDLVVERAAEAVGQAAEIARGNRPEFAGKFAERNQEWRERIEERQEKVEDRARREINRTEGVFEDWDGPELEERLGQAREAMEEGNYQEAREIAQEVRSEARKRRYEEVREDPGRVSEEVGREMMSLRERAQELREMNEEFGDMMQENMTVEERLETTESFRERRREKVQELVDEAAQRGAPQEIPGRGR